MGKPVVVVGGGLCGLVCARGLVRKGVDVVLVEASSAVGGRLASERIEGFTVDRGFQVVFDSYPYAGRELVWEKLQLGRFTAGARILWDGKFNDVLRDDQIHMALSRFIGIGDKIRTWEFSSLLAKTRYESVWEEQDRPAHTLLRESGFSEGFIDRFVRPFFGGVFLDRSLSYSGNALSYMWKVANEGDACVPAKGMDELARQVAEEVPSLRLGVAVDNVLYDDGRVAGVQLADGTTIEAASVVLACGPSVNARLSGTQADGEYRACSTVWLATDAPVTDDPILLVNGNFQGLVNHMVDVALAAPGRAPAGRGLVAATVLGPQSRDREALAKDVAYECKQWLKGSAGLGWEPIAVHQIDDAQWFSAPGSTKELKGFTTPATGLHVTDESTSYPGIDGACWAARQCARHVVAQLEPAAV